MSKVNDKIIFNTGYELAKKEVLKKIDEHFEQWEDLHFSSWEKIKEDIQGSQSDTNTEVKKDD